MPRTPSTVEKQLHLRTLKNPRLTGFVASKTSKVSLWKGWGKARKFRHFGFRVVDFGISVFRA